MAPKKPNGFMSFMFEWKEKHGRNMSLAQATSAAGAVWSKMSAKQREPHLKRAQATLGQLKSKKEKLTCSGTPIDVVERSLKEREKTEEEMIQNIARTVKRALDGKRLLTEKFYFLNLNYFVRLLNDDIYVPAEISVVEFSLKEGVSRKYHTFVNPNIDLFGNVYEAQHHSETTHQLPIPPSAKGESDMSKISAEILSFIFDKRTGLYPPIYTHNRAMNYVSSGLFFISEENGLSQINIYSLQELFYALKCAVCELEGIEKPRNRFVCDIILEKDAFEYASNIACDYHEEIDRSNYCSLSHVYRWGFAFIDFMASDLSIKLIPGYHMPGTIKPSEVRKERNINAHNHNVDAMTSGACGSMSMLSIDCKHQSCDLDQTGVSSSRFLVDSQAKITPVKPKPTTKDYDSKMDSIYCTNDLSYNPWQRHDDSKPPDSRFLSIDFDDEVETSVLSNSSRRFPRGRGFAILDDFK